MCDTLKNWLSRSEVILLGRLPANQGLLNGLSFLSGARSSKCSRAISKGGSSPYTPRPDAALAAVGQGFICLHYSVSILEHSKTAVRLRL